VPGNNGIVDDTVVSSGRRADNLVIRAAGGWRNVVVLLTVMSALWAAVLAIPDLRNDRGIFVSVAERLIAGDRL